jgi:hypothetical protein
MSETVKIGQDVRIERTTPPDAGSGNFGNWPEKPEPKPTKSLEELGYMPNGPTTGSSVCD